MKIFHYSCNLCRARLCRKTFGKIQLKILNTDGDFLYALIKNSNHLNQFLFYCLSLIQLIKQISNA